MLNPILVELVHEPKLPKRGKINCKTKSSFLKIGCQSGELRQKSKSVQVTFTLRKDSYPPILLNNNQLPQADHTKISKFI